MDEREVVRQAAKELLSPRQQRILQLSFDGWSVADIATDMRLSGERVSDEKYKSIQRLRQYLANNTVTESTEIASASRLTA